MVVKVKGIENEVLQVELSDKVSLTVASERTAEVECRKSSWN